MEFKVPNISKVHSYTPGEVRATNCIKAHANKVPSIFDFGLLLIVFVENDILKDQAALKRANANCNKLGNLNIIFITLRWLE